ncbi:MAG: 3-deoxy-D-manno-octulosonic acid transferase [Negativicutes bacterium]|nr:3-deoxy-D-manno-octulosonic acid transferase [Negativicutes bacterium]
MQILYNILATLLVVLAMPVFAVRVLREKGFAERLRQSLGLLPADTLNRVAGKQCIWLHAASVGEIVATSPIVKEIKKELPDAPVLISAVTETGYSMAKRIIPEADAVIFFPLDLPWLCRRVVRRVRPRVFLPVETELWPNFLRAVRAQQVPVMMVNGRISDKSVKRYHYLGSILRAMLDTVDRFCMQSTIDAQYIIRLGADPRRVVVTGNTKYDQTYTDVSDSEKQELFQELRIGGHRPVIVAGSTHKGEEEMVFAAFAAVRGRYPDARLIVAPRDINRGSEVLGLAEAAGFAAGRRTVLKTQAAEPDIVILDTIGELGRIYSLGDIIYVGGSLVPHGGHNILEPAAHGKPILVGPHMFNFKDIYALLGGRGACETVYDAAELGEKLLQILADEQLRAKMGEQSLAIILENRGAARKSALYLKELLAKFSPKNSE